MLAILDYNDQTLEDDFVFESDPKALESILNHRGLNSRGALTEDVDFKKPDYDYFKGRNGQLFRRPKRILCASATVIASTTNDRKKANDPFLLKSETKKRNVLSEVKPVRSTISEQRPRREERIERPAVSKARKGLEFKPQVEEVRKPEGLAQWILLRESLAGVPRASLTGLFRQSLTMAELNRLFDDDSTDSFEALEKRLKTPKKRNCFQKQVQGKRIFQSFVKNDDNNDAPFINNKDEDKENAEPPPTDSNLLRSQSCVELKRSMTEDSVVLLHHSLSLENLNEDSPSWLDDAKRNLERFKRERELALNKVNAIAEKARIRKENFKLQWGVSPKNIHRLKSHKSELLKNMFIVREFDEVAFSDSSHYTNDPPLEGNSIILSDKEEEEEEEGPFHNEKNNEFTKKTVRFATPQKKNLDDSHEHFDSLVRVNIPLHFHRLPGNISFDETKNSQVFVNTSIERSGVSSDDDDNNTPKRILAATPIALNQISSKAQRELASLYENVSTTLFSDNNADSE